MRLKSALSVGLVCGILAFQPIFSSSPVSPSPALAGEVSAGGTVELFGAVYFKGKHQAESRFGEVRFRPTLTCTPLEPLLIYLEAMPKAPSILPRRGPVGAGLRMSARPTSITGSIPSACASESRSSTGP